jgi:trimeric autotransporter adhesin
MKTRKLSHVLAALLAAAFTTNLYAQTDTFTYQGRLQDNGLPAIGSYDLGFSLFQTNVGGIQIGPALSHSGVAVSNGLFTVDLMFSPGTFDGGPPWLQIDVRTNGGGLFTPLAPRQLIASAPYAIYAGRARTLDGTLADGQLASNYSSNVNFLNPANRYAGDGEDLTNLNATLLGGLNSGSFWHLGGNVGTTQGMHFLGTTDNQALELKVNGVRALRLEPTDAGLPNVIGGPTNNQVAGGVAAAFIGGGYNNSIRSGGDVSAILGGYFNVVQSNAPYAMILGGRLNTAGRFALAAGHHAKADHPGAFVWADSEDADFPSTKTNQFSVRASGGVRFQTGGAGVALDGQPVLSGQIQAAQLADGAVTLAKLAPDSIDGSAILNGAVTSADIADGTVRSTDVDASSFGTTFWKIDGNAGTTIATHFLGTTDDQPLEIKVNGLRALRVEPTGNSLFSPNGNATGAPNLIGGSPVNLATPGVVGAAIGGGGATNVNGVPAPNTIAGDFGTIAGGYGNSIGVRAFLSAIGGGALCVISTNAFAATIAGGLGNSIGAASSQGMIGGGIGNHIGDNSTEVTIAGGQSNGIGTNSDHSTIGGGESNGIRANSHSATIAGGGDNLVRENCGFSAIVGGWGNEVKSNSFYSTIAGGYQNSIGPETSYGFVGGGRWNNIAPHSLYAAVAEGYSNGIGADSPYTSISGGLDNQIADNAPYATIPGGRDNYATNYAFAAGRRAKADHTGTFVWADSLNADFASTAHNQFLIRASGGVGIGTTNPTSRLTVRDANHQIALVDEDNDDKAWTLTSIQSTSGFGVYENGVNARLAISAGGSTGIGTAVPEANLHVYSTDNPATLRVQSAGTPGYGRLAFVSNPQGDANVWRPGYIQSTDNGGFTGGLGFFVNGTGVGNKFGNVEVMRVVNRRVGIGTNNPSQALHVIGNILATGTITPNSDRNAKTDVVEVDTAEILARVISLPIRQWRFHAEATGIKHVGPMAQDFRAAFGLGEHPTAIATVDADGVALAAIQGLNEKVEAENRALREAVDAKAGELSVVKQRLAALEQLLSKLHRQRE